MSKEAELWTESQRLSPPWRRLSS